MKVLIVDDSKAMRMIVKRTLKLAGFDDLEFVEAGNGVEAIAQIAAENPDVVFSDWNMPEMNGIELLKKLRADGNQIKLGFITSENSPATKQEAMDAGASFVINKPFTPESFKSVLQPVLA